MDQRGDLGVLPTPLVVLISEGMNNTLLLLPTPGFLLQVLRKWQLVFLVCLYLLPRICPNYTCMQLFLVPYSFFAFCCWRFAEVQALHHLQQRVPDPRPVSFTQPPPRDSTPLFLRDNGPRISSYTSSCWSGAAYFSLY